MAFHFSSIQHKKSGFPIKHARAANCTYIEMQSLFVYNEPIHFAVGVFEVGIISLLKFKIKYFFTIIPCVSGMLM